MISLRTLAAFAAMRARGISLSRPENRLPETAQKLGTAAANLAAMELSKMIYADLVPVIKRLRSEDHSLTQIADALNEMGHRTQRKTLWTKGTVYTLLKRNALPTSPPSWWCGTTTYRLSLTKRTKDRYSEIVPLVRALRQAGCTLATIANQLNRAGHRTHRGLQWNAASLNNFQQRRGTLQRLYLLASEMSKPTTWTRHLCHQQSLTVGQTISSRIFPP